MNKETTTERLHHLYSPSKLQCLEACSKFASAFTGSEAAEMGTRQHAVAESGVDDPTLPDEKALAVVDCLKFVDEHAREWPGCQRLQEIYLPIDDEVIESKGEFFLGTTAGYLDMALISQDHKRAKIFDYKYGQVAVEDAENNLQMVSYGLGLLKRFPELEEFTAYLLMPHRDAVSFHTFKRSEFPALLLRVKTVVARAVEANKVEGDFSKANPTVSGCLFCSRIGRCPKVAELALRLGKKYAPLQMPESISTSVFLDPADAARGIRFAQVIKQWAESYRAQATAKSIDSPDFIPTGFKLVQTTKRKVVSAIALGEFAKTCLPVELHPNVESLYDVALGGLEKLISTAAPRGNKEKAVAYFGERALEAGLLEMSEPYSFLRQDNAK